MNYKYIINPRTNKKISIKSKLGKQILFNYLNNYLNKNLYGGIIELSDTDPNNFIAKLQNHRNELNIHAQKKMTERDIAHDFKPGINETTFKIGFNPDDVGKSESDMTYEYIRDNIGIAKVDYLYYVHQKIKFTEGYIGPPYTPNNLCVVDGDGNCEFTAEQQGSLHKDLQKNGFMYYDAGSYSVFHKDNTTWANLFDPATKANSIKNLPPPGISKPNIYSKITNTYTDEINNQYINARWQQLLIFIWYSKLGLADGYEPTHEETWPKIVRTDEKLDFSQVDKKLKIEHSSFYNTSMKGGKELKETEQHYRYFFIAINILRSLNINLKDDGDGGKLIATASWTKKPNKMRDEYNKHFPNLFSSENDIKEFLCTENLSFDLPISKSETFSQIIAKTNIYYKKGTKPGFKVSAAPSLKKDNLNKISKLIINLLDKFVKIDKSDEKPFIQMYIGLLLKLLGDTSFILALLYDNDAFLRTFDNYLAMRAIMFKRNVLAECYPTSHIFKQLEKFLPELIRDNKDDYAFFYYTKTDMKLTELPQKIIKYIDFSETGIKNEVINEFYKDLEMPKDDDLDKLKNENADKWEKFRKYIYEKIIYQSYIKDKETGLKRYSSPTNFDYFKAQLTELTLRAIRFFIHLYQETEDWETIIIEQSEKWNFLSKFLNEPREKLILLINIQEFIEKEYIGTPPINLVDIDNRTKELQIPMIKNHSDENISYIDRILENFIFKLMGLCDENLHSTIPIKIGEAYKVGINADDFKDEEEGKKKRKKKASTETSEREKKENKTYKLYEEISLYLDFFNDLENYQSNKEDFNYLVDIIKKCSFKKKNLGPPKEGRVIFQNTQVSGMTQRHQNILQLGIPTEPNIYDFLKCVDNLLKGALNATGGYIINSDIFYRYFTNLQEKYKKFMHLLGRHKLSTAHGGGLVDITNIDKINTDIINYIQFRYQSDDYDFIYNFSIVNIIYLFVKYLKKYDIKLSIISRKNLFLTELFNIYSNLSVNDILKIFINTNYVNQVFNMYFIAHCKETHSFNDIIDFIDLRNKYFRILLDFIYAIDLINNNFKDIDIDNDIDNDLDTYIQRFADGNSFFLTLHQRLLTEFRPRPRVITELSGPIKKAMRHAHNALELAQNQEANALALAQAQEALRQDSASADETVSRLQQRAQELEAQAQKAQEAQVQALAQAHEAHAQRLVQVAPTEDADALAQETQEALEAQAKEVQAQIQAQEAQEAQAQAQKAHAQVALAQELAQAQEAQATQEAQKNAQKANTQAQEAHAQAQEAHAQAQEAHAQAQEAHAQAQLLHRAQALVLEEEPKLVLKLVSAHELAAQAEAELGQFLYRAQMALEEEAPTVEVQEAHAQAQLLYRAQALAKQQAQALVKEMEHTQPQAQAHEVLALFLHKAHAQALAHAQKMLEQLLKIISEAQKAAQALPDAQALALVQKQALEQEAVTQEQAQTLARALKEQELVQAKEALALAQEALALAQAQAQTQVLVQAQTQEALALAQAQAAEQWRMGLRQQKQQFQAERAEEAAVEQRKGKRGSEFKYRWEQKIREIFRKTTGDLDMASQGTTEPSSPEPSAQPSFFHSLSPEPSAQPSSSQSSSQEPTTQSLHLEEDMVDVND